MFGINSTWMGLIRESFMFLYHVNKSIQPSGVLSLQPDADVCQRYGVYREKDMTYTVLKLKRGFNLTKLTLWARRGNYGVFIVFMGRNGCEAPRQAKPAQSWGFTFNKNTVKDKLVILQWCFLMFGNITERILEEISEPNMIQRLSVANLVEQVEYKMML